jgi:hypothetical protein
LPLLVFWFSAHRLFHRTGIESRKRVDTPIPLARIPDGELKRGLSARRIDHIHEVIRPLRVIHGVEGDAERPKLSSGFLRPLCMLRYVSIPSPCNS